MKDFQLDLSVIVCCYNSAQRIRPTLEHLAKQNTTNFLKWEVIVVDNNSNDGTSELVFQIWEELKSDIAFKVVYENRPGLSNARKKGILSANGEILIFCDDDNWFEEHYVQIAYNLMSEDNSIGMLGGIGQEVIGGDKPTWFENVKLAYAVGPQNDVDGDITFIKGYVYGAGSIVRKSVLFNIYEKGFINQLTDRIGKVLVSGGDNEIGYMIALSGFKIYYSSKLKFKHYLPESRLMVSYLCRLAKGKQLTCYKIRCYEKYVLNKQFQFPENRFRGFKKSIIEMLKLLIRFILNKISYFEFKISFIQIFYESFYLLLYYNQFKSEILLVMKNIQLYKDDMSRSYF
ncbi:glycosyltransferase [Flavobacterium sp.]|uniref:glycosyltransferase n=1 Tax=Flavobacterium sp. TaxID=239 RepID=UPI0026088143|nr:glycosyltransferase [Flavobacterium sp.]